MVRIISRRLIDTQPVYDIGVEQDHNFLLGNGLVASNCFNKSHSFAYGYVTYQTAYLKANYPTEYMAALLTANAGDQDKIPKYIDSCRSMGIQVDPPDINRSGVDFTPYGKTILFGLSAVRNVGMGPVECILSARQESGPFQSLADLCDRVDARTVNRRALEALIYAGAMDQLEPTANRNQLIQDLDLILDWAQSRARDRASGQGNLFDLLGGTGEQKASSGFEMAPKASPVPDFPQQERLRLEKEILGFYISDHPLKQVRESARILAPINLSELEQCPENTTLSAIVLVTSVKPVITKKGDRMAITQIEDLTGGTEAVVFPKSFERIGEVIQADARLMVWGKVDRRDDQIQFIIDDAEPIESIQMVMVELSPQLASDIEQQHRLRNVLQQNRGEDDRAKVPVVAVVSANDRRHFVRFGAQFRVHDHQATVNALLKAGFQARVSPLASA